MLSGLTLIATLIIGVYKFWQFVNIKKEDVRDKGILKIIIT